MKQVILFTLLFLSVFSCSNDPVPEVAPPLEEEAIPAASFISFEPVWATDLSNTQAFANLEKTWADYRDKFKWHSQMLGLQTFEEDGSYLFIISEPPPHMSLNELESLFSFYNSRIEVKQHPVGYDGWVKDVVVAVADLPQGELQKLIRKLNFRLFQSPYKADYFLPLPIQEKPKNFLKESLNYQVTFAELEEWFLEENEPLLQSDGTPANISQLLNEGTSGTYFSQEPGFVVWTLPNNADLAQHKDHLRRFALDADMVLGAISGNGNLAIIGRERLNSVAELPPLRTETLLLLAAADKAELAQSYERTMFLAGKTTDGRDWAPIYLSDELINTEYGSLLNITDQMLKSWSSNGKITYHEWGYPKPGRYAFKNGVMDDIETGSLTFNWNTKGAAYVAAKNTFEIVSLNRTGALPVSYIPEGMEGEKSSGTVKKAEEKAYNYFSSLNNPDLVRVVQYGALYQIFRLYGISSSETPENGSKPATNPLIDDYVAAIGKFSGLGSSEIARLAKKMVTGEGKKMWGDISDLMSTLYLGDAVEEAQKNLTEMQHIAESITNEGKVSSFSSLLAAPREGQQMTEEEYQLSLTGSKFGRHAFNIASLNYGYYLDLDIDGVLKSYVDGWGNSQSEWIKTPSVVMSWHKERFFATGGHNLNSRVVPFKVADDLLPGQFRVEEVNGTRQVFVSKGTLNNMNPRMLRAVEDAQVGTGRFMLGEMPKVNLSPRLRPKVIPAAQRPVRGFHEGHINVRKTAKGFELEETTYASYADFNRALKEAIGKNKGSKAEVHMEGMMDDEVLATLHTQRIKSGFAFKKGMMNGEGFFKRLTGETCDFSRATIHTMPEAGKIVVEIPMRNSIAAKIRLTISRLSKDLVTRVEAILKKVFKRCESNPRLDFETEFFNELKLENINPDDLIFAKEAMDVIIGMLPEQKKQEGSPDFSNHSALLS